MRAVRYADDAVIFAKSRKSAERILQWVKKYIEDVLFLQVNESKTKILKIGSPEVQFLGFSFTDKVSKTKKTKFPDYKYFPVVHTKKQQKLKEQLKRLLDRRAPGGIQVIKEALARKLRGWVNYFKKAIPSKWRGEIDGWIRRRTRQLLWKQWKTGQKREQEFRRRWKKAPSKEDFAYSSNRYWRMSMTPQINIALDNATLEREGWFTLEMASRK